MDSHRTCALDYHQFMMSSGELLLYICSTLVVLYNLPPHCFVYYFFPFDVPQYLPYCDFACYFFLLLTMTLLFMYELLTLIYLQIW